MQISILDLNGSSQASPEINLAVDFMEWCALGYCSQAQVSAVYNPHLTYGGEDEMHGFRHFFNYLRNHVEISDGGNPAWWGFISGITIQRGKLAVTFSLDRLSNRVKVNYQSILAVNAGGGSQVATAWASDTQSQSIYGIKELVKNVGYANATYANSLRDLLLAIGKYPQILHLIKGSEETRLIFHLSGWWKTIGWKYYDQVAAREQYTDQDGKTQVLGAAAASTAVAQSFQVNTANPWRAETAYVCIRLVGAPADNVVVDLCADNAGAPGAVLATGSVVGSTLATNYKWQVFTFAVPYALALSTTYWIKVSRSGAVSAANYYRVLVNEAARYASGSCLIYGGAAWAARAPAADMNFRIAGSNQTSDIITYLLNASYGGQFITGYTIPATGVYLNPFQPGTKTALELLEDLLLTGNATGSRLLAEITSRRHYNQFVIPLSSERPAFVDDDGYLKYLSGQTLPLSEKQAGMWVDIASPWLRNVQNDGLPSDFAFVWRSRWENGFTYPVELGVK